MKNTFNICVEIKEGESLDSVIENLKDIRQDMQKINVKLISVLSIQPLLFGCSKELKIEEVK